MLYANTHPLYQSDYLPFYHCPQQKEWEKLIQKGDDAYWASDLDNALSYYQKATSLIKKELPANDSLYIISLERQGIICYYQYKTEEGLKLYHKALALEKNALPHLKGEYGGTLKAIADLHFQLPHQDSAVYYYEKSYEVFNSLGKDYRSEAYWRKLAIINIAVTFTDISAIEEGENLLTELQNNGFKKTEHEAYLFWYLGLLYESAYRYKEAQSNFERSYAVFQNLKDQETFADKVLLDIASLKDNLGQKAAADLLFDELEKRFIARGEEDYFSLCMFWIERGDYHYRRSNYPDALNYYKLTAKTIYGHEKESENYIRVLTHNFGPLIRMERYSEVIALSNTILDYYRVRRGIFSTDYASGLAELANAYYGQNHYQKAYALFDSAFVIYDSLKTPESDFGYGPNLEWQSLLFGRFATLERSRSILPSNGDY